MDTPANQFEALVEKVETYAKTSIELTKLRMLESGINLTTKIVVRLSVFAVIAFFLLFMGLGSAFLLGKMLGHVYLGFFALAGFYVVVAVILHFFLHRWIKKPLSEFILAHLIQ